MFDNDRRDWSLLGQWNVFASPVSHVAPLFSPEDESGHAIVALVSANSPVALLSLSDPVGVWFVLPGTKSPVERLATHPERDEILVLYEQGLARTCFIKGKELRRSMDYKTALRVLDEPGWRTW